MFPRSSERFNSYLHRRHVAPAWSDGELSGRLERQLWLELGVKAAHFGCHSINPLAIRQLCAGGVGLHRRLLKTTASDGRRVAHACFYPNLTVVAGIPWTHLSCQRPAAIRRSTDARYDAGSGGFRRLCRVALHLPHAAAIFVAVSFPPHDLGWRCSAVHRRKAAARALGAGLRSSAGESSHIASWQ